MTQEQYNRYMDGLVLKVASKRPMGKVASFRKRADEWDETANLINGLPRHKAQINYLQNSNQAQDANEKTERIGLQYKAQVANNDVDARDRMKAITKQTVNTVDARNKLLQEAAKVSKAVMSGKIKPAPEAPWYSKAYEWVRENPKTSLAIGGGALAGGLLLAYLMRKKEKDAKKQKATKKHKFIVGNPSLAFA